MTSIARIIDVVRTRKIQCKRLGSEERSGSDAATSDPVIVELFAVGVVSAIPLVLDPTVA